MTQDPLVGGVILDRFAIEERLGSGGMGVVYRARETESGRELALKVIDSRHARDRIGLKRFAREATLTRQLDHPNTVHVIDVGQLEDGRPFLAMELLTGRTLVDVVDGDGPMPLTRAIQVGIAICDALEAAHALHIVHRDLKPANVMILDRAGDRAGGDAPPPPAPPTDAIKVLDFGLAKSTISNHVEGTLSGQVVGTPRYMAPELGYGEPASPSSDLYALGVLLAEITTGRKLWPRVSFPQLMTLKYRGLPANPEIPARLVPLLQRLVCPDPKGRPARAAEVRELLVELAAGGEVPPPPPPDAPELTAPTMSTSAAVRPRRGRWVVLGVVVVVAIGVASALLLI